MSGPHPINITPNNNEVVFNNINNSITITNNVDHNVVEIIQPVTTVVEVNTGIVGPPGSTVVATSGSFSGSFTGSLNGTSSWSNNSLTASYYGGSVISSSYAATSSNSYSSSFALTASYVANASSFPFTGSALISGSLIVTGSIIGDFTGSLQGTSSYSLTSSYATTASYVANASSFPYTGSALITGSLGVTGSFSVKGSDATSANYALKVDNSALSPLLYVRNDGVTFFNNSAYILNGVGFQSILTGDVLGTTNNNLNILAGINTPSSNIVRISYYGNTQWLSALSIQNSGASFGNLLLMQDGGNVGIGTTTPTSKLHLQGSGSSDYALKVDNSSSSPLLYVRNDGLVTISGSLQVTDSITGSFTGSLQGSSSYALTASYALNGGGGGTIDTGSLVTTSSFNSFTSSYNSGSFTGSFTGSLFGTSSYSLTASYVPDGVTLDGVQTLTNKRITKRVLIITSSATPTFNSDDYDFIKIISQSSAITSMTSGLSGTPTEAQLLWYQIKDNGTARAITWGASFEAKGQALPTTTTINKRLNVLFSWDSVTAKWGCLDAIVEA